MLRSWAYIPPSHGPDLPRNRRERVRLTEREWLPILKAFQIPASYGGRRRMT